ncbi:MAG: InlB B-repeat-containing protein, partial [Oscillospiraceae bacterium]
KASFSETVKPNSKPTAPSASPVKTGYTFKNWYTEKTGGKLYNTVTSITTSQTFYAQFTANTYTVTWNLGDGRSETTEQTYGEKLVLPTDPERKNANFSWLRRKRRYRSYGKHRFQGNCCDNVLCALGNY